MRIGLAILAAVTHAAPAWSSAQLPSDSAVRAIIRERVESKRNTGIIVGLLDADGRRRVVAYGAGMPGGRPLDGRSVVEIGSVTKVLTGSLLADMIVRGEVAADDPVARHLPADLRVPSRNGREITLATLATNTAGLPREVADLDPAAPRGPCAVAYTSPRLRAFLAAYALPRDPGERFEYSNLGYSLLGQALAQRAGKWWGALLRERILGPLGMRSTFVSTELTDEAKARLASGHDVWGQPLAGWDFGVAEPSGGLLSTADDMLTFLAAQLDTATPLGRAFALARTPRVQASPVAHVGFGWAVRRMPNGNELVWKNGATGGYTSIVGFDPTRRIGVAVLSTSATLVDDIALHLLDASLPLAPPPLPAPILAGERIGPLREGGRPLGARAARLERRGHGYRGREARRAVPGASGTLNSPGVTAREGEARAPDSLRGRAIT